ncbi:MAG: oxidoreductase [Chloroflexi bacterium]|nr:oxidoreductase [Chloroflexota bacterium]
MVTLNQTYTKILTFSQSDFDRFAALSGDDNPIHVDPVHAAKTKFGSPVAHGMFLYSHICAALHECLPEMTQIEQQLMFPGPTFTDEMLTLQLYAQTLLANGAIEIETTLTRPDGSLGLTGKTTVVPRQFSIQGDVDVSHKAVEKETAVSLNHLQLGQSAQAVRTFTRDEVSEFVALIGNMNTRFLPAQNMVPNGLLAGMFSDLLGTQVPGRGTNWLKQRLVFPQPAYVGDEITAVVTISRIRPEKSLVNLQTTCSTATGDVVCWGEALVWVNELEKSYL